MKKSISYFFLRVLLLSTFAFGAFAQPVEGPHVELPYYGKDFFKETQSGKLAGQKLLERLHETLYKAHVMTPGKPDTLVATCTGGPCFQHRVLGYDLARQYLMGKFYLIPLPQGQYGLKDVYCDRIVTPEDYPNKNDLPGERNIPDGNIVNTEHTWPQSRFSRGFSPEMQKSDLHHLFPTDNKLNSLRGNFPFGEVAQDSKKDEKCKAVRFGVSDLGEPQVFEPPPKHKGNVARALFYFATRYRMHIDANQEATLRLWHKEDPIDYEEAYLNNEIFHLQATRNPYIDNPWLVDLISDF